MNRDRLSFPFEDQGIEILVFVLDVPVDKQIAFKEATGHDLPVVHVCALVNKRQQMVSVAFQFTSTGNDYADQVLRGFITQVSDYAKARVEKKSASDVWSDFIDQLDLDFPDVDDSQGAQK